MSTEVYRRVVPTFWSDPDVKRPLSREQKLLALYFFTSPHSNMIGLYYCPLEYVAAETDLTVPEIRAALAGALSKFVSYDEDTEEAFVHGLAKHNIGSELKIGKDKKGTEKPDHRIAGVRKLIEAAHSKRLIHAFLSRYGSKYQLDMALPDVPNTPSKPLASPLEGVQQPTVDPFEAKAVAVAVAVAATQHDTTKQHSSDTTYPGCARSGEIAPAEKPNVPPAEEDAISHSEFIAAMRKVCSGRNDPITEADATQIGSIAKRMFDRGWSRRDVYFATIGWRAKIDRGEIKHIPAGSKFTLAKLYDKDPTVDQMQVGLDAYHATAKPPPGEKRKPSQPEQIDPMDFVTRFGKPEQGAA